MSKCAGCPIAFGETCPAEGEREKCPGIKGDVIPIKPEQLAASPGSLEPTGPGTYVVRDSGAREEFATGAKRDTEDGKPRYDLISTFAKRRLALHLARGAKKYGERNWEAGMPVRRYLSSAERHLNDYQQGDRTEDHLSAVLFNVMAIVHFEELGIADYDGLPDYTTAGQKPAGLTPEG